MRHEAWVALIVLVAAFLLAFGLFFLATLDQHIYVSEFGSPNYCYIHERIEE